MLIEHLPPDAATVLAVSGPIAEWSTTEYLLAQIFDALAIGNWQRGQGKDADRPKPFPRPGERANPKTLQEQRTKDAPKKFATPSELRGFVDSLHQSV